MGPAPVVNIRFNAAPRPPFGFVRKAGRAACALTAAASALTPAARALALVLAPTHATSPITTQKYFLCYHLGSARQEGYTGKGAAITLIDGLVDTSVPELAGATITDKSRCTIEISPAGTCHDTGIATLFVSSYAGTAPDAALYTYQTATVDAASSGACKSNRLRLDIMVILINQATDDGTQITSVLQSSMERDSELQWALVRATSEGAITVASAGDTASDNSIEQLIRWSDVVGVSAIDSSGTFAPCPSWGSGIVIVALGGPINTVNVNTEAPATTSGISNSAVLVSGMFALVR